MEETNAAWVYLDAGHIKNMLTANIFMPSMVAPFFDQSGGHADGVTRFRLSQQACDELIAIRDSKGNGNGNKKREAAGIVVINELKRRYRVALIATKELYEGDEILLPPYNRKPAYRCR